MKTLFVRQTLNDKMAFQIASTVTKSGWRLVSIFQGYGGDLRKPLGPLWWLIFFEVPDDISRQDVDEAISANI